MKVCSSASCNTYLYNRNIFYNYAYFLYYYNYNLSLSLISHEILFRKGFTMICVRQIDMQVLTPFLFLDATTHIFFLELSSPPLPPGVLTSILDILRQIIVTMMIVCHDFIFPIFMDLSFTLIVNTKYQFLSNRDIYLKLVQQQQTLI